MWVTLHFCDSHQSESLRSGNPILSLWEGFFPLFLFLSTFTYFNYRKALDYAHSRNLISAITQSRTGSR